MFCQEMLSALLTHFVRGIPRWFTLTKGQYCGDLMWAIEKTVIFAKKINQRSFGVLDSVLLFYSKILSNTSGFFWKVIDNWEWDEMAVSLQVTFSHAFSIVSWIIVQCILFFRFHLTIYPYSLFIGGASQMLWTLPWNMMALWRANASHITGHLWGKQRAINAELFLCY